MYKNHEYLLSIYYRFTDLLFLNVAFFIGIYLRFYSNIFNQIEEAAVFSFIENEYVSLLLLVNVSWLFVSNAQNIYNLESFTSKNRYALAVITAVFLQFLISIAFNGLIKTYYSRLFLLYTYFIFSILLIVARKLTYIIVQKRIVKSTRRNSIVVFSSKNTIKEISSYLKNNISTVGQKIIEIDRNQFQISKLEQIHKVNPISEIFIPISNFNENEIEEVSNFCDNRFVRLRLMFDWKKVSAKNLNLGMFNQIPIIKISLSPLDDQYNALIKRGFDVTFSILLTIFLFSWLFPIIAIAVKASSRGPIFFKQKRSGLNGKVFHCYKFRSMKVNSQSDHIQATKGDSRITKIGSFLRKSSLDELPQFFNVLFGQMSIVGPRPHMLKHTEDYSILVGNFMNRHAIKPGITGLAQIKGFRGEISDFALLQNRVRLDRFYVNNWTLFFDIKIIALTVTTLLKSYK